MWYYKFILYQEQLWFNLFIKYIGLLDLLLNKDGSLVCTHIPNLTNPTIDLKEEILLFEKYFQYEELYNKESDGILYYKYTKKTTF